MSNTLYILDLDHSLIYSDYSRIEGLDLIGVHKSLHHIHKRPFVREFLASIQQNSELIVYSAAKEDYVRFITRELNIPAVEILHRKHCRQGPESATYRKWVRQRWKRAYERIVIFDDSPHLWESRDHEEHQWIIPSRFMGDTMDEELLKLMQEILLI